MPKNCSADVQAVIKHVDQVFTNGNTSQVSSLKANWGMQDVTHSEDVAGACTLPCPNDMVRHDTNRGSVRNNLWGWQDMSPSSGPNAGLLFFNFCDVLEVKNGISAPASGWGLDHALTAWGDYWKNGYLYSRKQGPFHFTQLW